MIVLIYLIMVRLEKCTGGCSMMVVSARVQEFGKIVMGGNILVGGVVWRVTMFLICEMCKFSSPYPVSDGADEDNLYKCRKYLPTANDENKRAVFPIVPFDSECGDYRKKMVG